MMDILYTHKTKQHLLYPTNNNNNNNNNNNKLKTNNWDDIERTSQSYYGHGHGGYIQ